MGDNEVDVRRRAAQAARRVDAWVASDREDMTRTARAPCPGGIAEIFSQNWRQKYLALRRGGIARARHRGTD
ncbi:hypothetical protein [Achromobacter insuavis]|uniref:hypothetical protein n=1 Tax=Achromobacter insuavis TaxID=1287735 RepID=UPI001F13AF73|nr:hypothetical protein [Achromobacter insuavis]